MVQRRIIQNWLSGLLGAEDLVQTHVAVLKGLDWLILLVLTVEVLLYWGRHRCYLCDSFEFQKVLLHIGIEEERGLDVADPSKLTQLLLTLGRSLIKIESFSQVSILESAITVFSIPVTHSFPIEKSILKLALVFGIILIFASKAVQFITDIRAKAQKLLIFAKYESNTYHHTLIVESKHFSTIWKHFKLKLRLFLIAEMSEKVVNYIWTLCLYIQIFLYQCCLRLTFYLYLLKYLIICILIMILILRQLRIFSLFSSQFISRWRSMSLPLLNWIAKCQAPDLNWQSPYSSPRLNSNRPYYSLLTNTNAAPNAKSCFHCETTIIPSSVTNMPAPCLKESLVYPQQMALRQERILIQDVWLICLLYKIQLQHLQAHFSYQRKNIRLQFILILPFNCFSQIFISFILVLSIIVYHIFVNLSL